MSLHTYLLADRIAANHDDDLIRSAAQQNLVASRHPASDRRRIALPIVATLRGLVSPRQRRRNELGRREPVVCVARHGLERRSSADVPGEPMADLTRVR